MNKAIYLNGVFESVLEEILISQKKNPGTEFYLQPHATRLIKLLQDENPSRENPIRIYISTSKNLKVVSYLADAVHWENKTMISIDRLSFLNSRIKNYQKNEEEIYLKSGEGNNYANLISIVNLERVEPSFSVSALKKISNGEPLKSRTRSGGWSYVHKISDNNQLITTITKEKLLSELEEEIADSLQMGDDERRNRLLAAPKQPKKFQVTTIAFKRNPDVIVEVLKRANGFCERCKSKAPFSRVKDNSPYLEVHHVVMLADGGEDTVTNAIAVCPNCHRELHFG